MRRDNTTENRQPRTDNRRRAAFVLLALTALALPGCGSGQPVEVAEVRSAPIREIVEDRGKTRLPRTWSLSMPFAGRVESLAAFPERTEVKKGQLLTQIVPRDLELRKEAVVAAKRRLEAAIVENNNVSVELVSKQQAEEMVRSMESTVAAATNRLEAGLAKYTYNQKNLERTNTLLRTRAKSEDEADQAQLQFVQSDVDYKQDKLVLASLQAMLAATKLFPVVIDSYMERKKGDSAKVLERQLDEIKVQLDEVDRDIQRGQLTSPIDGVVLERAIVDEQYVTAGATLLKLGSLRELEVEVDILSQDVGTVAVGDDAEILGPAIGPKPILGRVTRIYPAGFTKVSSLGVEQQRVKVIVAFAPADLQHLIATRGLGVDYRVRVRIITEQKPSALVIPRSALFRGADGQWTVYVVRDGRAEALQVPVGLMNDEFVEVTSKLTAGDQVILAPEATLKTGTKVKPELREPVSTSLPATGD
jgi:HlyD family secretion protein